MTRYVQGPQHARRGPHRGILTPALVLASALAVLTVLIVMAVI